MVAGVQRDSLLSLISIENDIDVKRDSPCRFDSYRPHKLNFTTMFKLFKNLPKPIFKSDKEIVEEIHEAFYTEVDRLLEFANIKLSTETQKEELLKKGERLRKLGFHSAKDTLEARKESDRLSKILDENNNKESIKKAINYFSFKYPNYKFITEESVKRICEDYGLIYGPVDKFIGEVPDVNLRHMEEFKIDEDDKCYMKITMFYFRSKHIEYISREQAKRLEESVNKYFERHMITETSRAPLEIVAVPKDFDLSDMEIRENKIVPKVKDDPIVLQPVWHGGNKHYLVVTAWGPEASDKDVVNERNN